jgi:hypothetical protein
MSLERGIRLIAGSFEVRQRHAAAEARFATDTASQRFASVSPRLASRIVR